MRADTQASDVRRAPAPCSPAKIRAPDGGGGSNPNRANVACTSHPMGAWYARSRSNTTTWYGDRSENPDPTERERADHRSHRSDSGRQPDRGPEARSGARADS